MGWRELLAWLGVMKRQLQGPEPDPYSWRVADPWFEETKRKIRGG
jgi:hypothetical protein